MTLTPAVVLALVTAGACFAAIRLLRAGQPPARSLVALGDYAPRGFFATWFAPALLLLSAQMGNLAGFGHLDLPTLAVVAASLGMGSAITSMPGMRALRDLCFSVLGALVSVGLLVQFVAQPPAALGSAIAAAAAVVPLAIAFGFGLFLNFLRLFALPRVGVGLLGAVDVLLFLANPTPVTVSLYPANPPIVLVLIAAAALLGFAASAAPEVVLVLTSIATVIFGVGVQLWLWMTSGGALDLAPAFILIASAAGARTVTAATVRVKLWK